MMEAGTPLPYCRQIVEEEEDRSEYLEASRMEESDEEPNFGQGAMRSRLGSRQLV